MIKDLVTAVIVNYNNRLYLERCINSILNQTYGKVEIIFIDNVSTDGSYEFVKEKFQKYNINLIKNNKNVGYAGGANQGIKLANGEYVLILNPDIVLEPNFIEICIETLNIDSRVASVSGKLLKYDFVRDQKLNIIDSTGIVVEHDRMAVDRGQNIEDCGQYNNIEHIFGVCGAAAFYKKEALEHVKVCDEYFDEDFFAYKEDVDLSWRLNLYGYKCYYNPNAVAYHGRGLGGSRGGIKNFINNRKNQSEFLRGISFRNHYLMLLKNETKYTFKRDKFKILKRTFLFLCYALLYERFIFKYIMQTFKLKNKMLKKREIIMQNTNISNFELYKLFDN